MPGLLLVLAMAIVVRLLHGLLPPDLRRLVSDPAAGMAVGLVAANTMRLPGRFKPGIGFAFDRLLKLAIILLGLRISLAQFADVGKDAILLVIGCMLAALFVAHASGALGRIPPKLSTLIGVGTAVCGNTAIAAVAPAIRAEEREMSFAIATNTLLGTAAVFLYPIIGQAMGLSDAAFGLWAGTAVNDTSQVVAVGFAMGDRAGDVAVTTKLVRNALMGFVIVGASAAYKTRSPGDALWRRMRLPGFVVAFLVLVAINSLGAFEWVSGRLYPSFNEHVAWLTRFLILSALIGVGLNTKFHSLRSVGFAPFLVGMATALVVSLLSLGVVTFLAL